MKDCYSCAYKSSVPGDAHISCAFNFNKAELPMPKGDPYGFSQGWYMFPANYDPNWMVTECQAHATESKPELLVDPMTNLINMLGGLR